MFSKDEMAKVIEREATMLRKLERSTGNTLGYEIPGKLTEKEFETLSEEFRATVAEHGKVRLLVRIPEMPRMELGALAEDLKLTPYARDVERYAISPVHLVIVHYSLCTW